MPNTPFTSCFLDEPRWQRAKWLRWQLSATERDWLLDSGSLTTRLIDLSEGQLTVTILRQQMLYPHLSEARLLGIPRKKLALVREVVLSGRGQPWVFARSILPLSTLTGRLRKLRTLDNRPLGGLLFKDSTMYRGEIEVARVNKKHCYIPGYMMSERSLWGRRSKFYLDNKPLLVSEVFLDSFNLG